MFRVELENGHIKLLIYLKNAYALHQILPGDKETRNEPIRFVKSKNYL
jgi:hypothetical protein